MTRRICSLTSATIAVLVLGACSKSELDQLHERHAESAQAVLQTLERLGTQDAFPDPAASDAWRGLTDVNTRALVYYRDALTDLTGTGDLVNPYRADFGLGAIVEFVRTGQLDELWFESERAYVESALARLSDPAAIVVIDPVDVRPGELVYANNIVTAYEPGTFRGNAHFFDRTGTHLGGFTFTASNPSAMSFVGRDYAFERARETLDGSLYRCAWQSYRAQLAAAFPQENIVVPDLCSPDE